MTQAQKVALACVGIFVSVMVMVSAQKSEVVASNEGETIVKFYHFMMDRCRMLFLKNREFVDAANKAGVSIEDACSCQNANFVVNTEADRMEQLIHGAAFSDRERKHSHRLATACIRFPLVE